MTDLTRRDLLRTSAAAGAVLALPAVADAASFSATNEDPFVEICRAMKVRMPPGYQLGSLLWTEGDGGFDCFACAHPKDGGDWPKLFFNGVSMTWQVQA